MSASPLPSTDVTPETPWIGLRPFSESAQEYFFGRTAELDDLADRILDRPLTILFGQSGLGKSSLLQAGLIPRLRATGFQPIYIRFNHGPGAPSLEEQMLSALAAGLAPDFPEEARATLTMIESERDHAAALWLLFHDPAHGLTGARGGVQPRPVFLVDPFEEIYTFGERPERRAVSATLRDSLASLVENRPPASLNARLDADDELAERLDYRARAVRVLLSLREEFLHVLERWRRAIPSVMENRLELRKLAGPQALDAVLKPGELRPGLPPIIPEEVGREIVRFVAGAPLSTPLEEMDPFPPLLSLVCAELNAQRLAAGEVQITRAQFEGHSDDILQDFYLRSFDPAAYAGLDLPPGKLAAGLGPLRSLIEERLLSPDGFRESIAMDTISHDLDRAIGADVAGPILDAVIDRRLLTVDERGGVRRLELAHDVLTRIVKTSREERQEKEFLARAQREKEQAQAETARIRDQRNRLRRLAIAATICAILALGAAAVAIVFYTQMREKQDELRQSAIDQRDLRARADTVMGFFIRDVTRVLRGQAQYKLVKEVADRIQAYNDATRRRTDDPASRGLAAKILSRQSDVLCEQGRIPEAMVLMRRRIELLEDAPAGDIDARCQLLEACNNLVDEIAFESGHDEPWTDAAPFLKTAKAIAADLQTRAPDNLAATGDIAKTWAIAAKYAAAESDDATSQVKNATALLGDETVQQTDQVKHLNETAALKKQECIDDFKKALGIVRSAPAKVTADPDFAGNASSVFWAYGRFLANTGKCDDAIKLYQEDIQLHKEALDTNFSDMEAKADIADDLREIGRVYSNQADAADAVDYYNQALAVDKETIKMVPEGTDGWWDEYSEFDNIARILDDKLNAGTLNPSDRVKTALETWNDREAEVEAARALVNIEPQSNRWKGLLFESLDDAAFSAQICLDAMRERGDKTNLLRCAKQAAALAEEELHDHQKQFTKRYYRSDLASAFLSIGQAFATAGDDKEAVPAFNSAIQVCQLLPEKKISLSEEYRGPAEMELARLYERQGNLEQMVRCLTAGLNYDFTEDLCEKLGDVYAEGEGVAVDRDKAIAYYEEARRRQIRRFTFALARGSSAATDIPVWIGKKFADGRTALDDCNLQLDALREKDYYLPPDVNTSLKELWDIAVSNKVSFADLLNQTINSYVKNPPKAGAPALTAVPDMDDAEIELKIARTRLAAADSDENRLLLAGDLGNAADAGLYKKRFQDAIDWSREALKLIDRTNPASLPKNRASLVFVYTNLAHALLFTGKFDDALAIYRAHWNAPMGSGTFKDGVIQDFAMFTREGMATADLVRMEKTLGIELPKSQ